MEDFIAKFQKLILDSPHLCVNSRNVENCPYGDYIYNCKNCYVCFELGGSQNGYYLDSSMKTQSCVDCSFARHSELCYQCLNIEKCYNCNYCIDVSNSNDLTHCFDCIGCNDCYGCVGLRRKNFNIYNVEYSKEEYIKVLKTIEFDENKFRKLDLAHPRQNLHLSKSEDCVGDYIYNSKNCVECFDINNMEDCIYYINGNFNSPDKNNCDMTDASGCELCYDCFSMGYSYNCNFLVESSYCTDCDFGFALESCKNCFGCTYLKNKQYFILNKPYSKEDYLAKIEELKSNLIKNGQYNMIAVTSMMSS